MYTPEYAWLIVRIAFTVPEDAATEQLAAMGSRKAKSTLPVETAMRTSSFVIVWSSKEMGGSKRVPTTLLRYSTKVV